jgi:hypothetical protein
MKRKQNLFLLCNGTKRTGFWENLTNSQRQDIDLAYESL